MKPRHTIGFLIGITLLVSCQSNKFKESEYTSMVVNASPGVETQVQMEDGAGINIPEESILGDVEIIIERNPEKAAALPELPEEFVQASDFYNYQVTQGELVGPVDLVMPFDESLKPDPEAELMVGFPINGGWNFVPITAVVNGKAVLYTDNLGDPVIGWRFSKLVKNPRPTMDARKLLDYSYCRSGVMVSVEPIEVMGSTYYKLMAQYYDPNGDVANARIRLELNYFIEGIQDNVFEAWTDENGYYENTLDTDSYSAIGKQAQDYYAGKGMDTTVWRNSVKVTPLECRSIAGNPNFPIEYYGVSIFDWQGTVSTPLFPQISDTTNNQSSASTAPAPVAPQETIPSGAIQLPSFVGMPFDEAVDWLKENGFKHMWKDGKSSYDVGVVYGQQPAAGKYKVPHRTTVMLYRTVEKVTDPCLDPVLTPEEKANCGTHTYQITESLTSHCSSMEVNNRTKDVKNIFSENMMTTIRGWEYIEEGVNVYIHEEGKMSDTSNINRHVYIITLSLSGFTESYAYEGPDGTLIDCWLDSYTLTK